MPRKIRIKAIPGTARRMSDVLLAEAVPALGKQGEIVRVRAGYARNYLVPYGLATIATESNKRRVEAHRAKQEELRLARLQAFRELAERVSKYSVTIEANANKDGHLYGSIVASDISGQLRNAGYDVALDHVRLDGPLKETGMYTVRIQFDSEISAEVKVWVVPKATPTVVVKS